MRRKLVVAGGLIVVALLAITTTNAYFKTHTPTRQLSQKFISYILKGDVSSSYALYAADVRATMSKTDWSSTVATVSNYFQNNSPSFAEETSSGQNTFDRFDIVGLDKQPYQFTVQLTKSEGKWQVTAFTSNIAQNTTPTNTSNTSQSSGSPRTDQ